VGGLTERLFGPLAPFQTAFCMLVFCTIFGALCLPYIAPTKTADSEGSKTKSNKLSFLAPLALFVPRRITYDDGSKGPRQWSLLFLALGAFFSVFATAFVPMGLQLVSTNVFGFRPAETGLMLVSAGFVSGLAQHSSNTWWVTPLTTVPDSTRQGLLPVNLFPRHHQARPEVVLVPQRYHSGLVHAGDFPLPISPDLLLEPGRPLGPQPIGSDPSQL